MKRFCDSPEVCPDPTNPDDVLISTFDRTDNQLPINDHRSPALLCSILVILIALFLLDLATGSVLIPLDQMLVILTGGEAERESWEKIVWLFRLPKALAAVLAGWYGHLPADLQIGEHTIEVKALDMFGRTFIQTGSYRIAKKP